MNAAIRPVILSGGSGTRLWPLSRAQYPKQFLPLTGDRSLFQETVERAAQVSDSGAPLVVSNEEQRFLVAEQLLETGGEPGSILLEPAGRNTAPAIALAALEVVESDPKALLLVLPADHRIGQSDAFTEAVATASSAAKEGALVTFGVVPDYPETGFGYIRAGSETGDGVRAVAEFVEKPDAERAEQYLAAGNYYWNSGMFLLRADRYLAELDHHAPSIAEACRRAHAGARRDMDFVRVDAEAFSESPADSIDYAVMERTDHAAMVPLNTEWSDVGSWAALKAVSESDESGNVIQGDVLSLDDRNCYLRADSRLLATAGLEDHVVVETPDAVLVAHRDRTQDVKRFVSELEAAGRSEHATHRCVHRPWGSYEPVADAERFQVKRIVIKPGQSLSLQMHHHRAEHWVVVRGTARVTRGEEDFLLAEDQSAYIPIGTVHRLANPGAIPLEIIEVQTGSYLGEDDIVRFEDHYGRGNSDEP